MPDPVLQELYAGGLDAIRRELAATDAPFTPGSAPLPYDGAIAAAVAFSAPAVGDDPWNAFIARRPEAAGSGGGPLSGASFAVKDNIDVAGFPTTSGGLLNGDPAPIAACDASVVADLRAAGGECVGKTNLGELALEAMNDNPHYGRTLNPLDRDRSPGGSSGGSGAAVAAGQVAFALGSDSGGSVRIPASACGVVGFRPSAGAVALDGLHGPAWTVDSIGVLASNVAVIAAALDAIHLRVAPRRTLAQPRMAYLADASMGRCQPQVWAVYQESLDRLRSGGVDLVPVSLSGLTLAPYVCAITAYVEVAAQLAEAVRRIPERIGAAVLPLLELGLDLSGVDYFDAQRMRGRLASRFEDGYRDFDAVLTPTLPITAPRWGEQPEIQDDDPAIALFALIRFTCIANLTGAPSVSVPAGVADDGMPVGLQITGHRYDDIALLELAARAEALVPAADGSAA